MRSLRIAILWILGIILWVFGLTVGLGWLEFGYLDWKTIVTMGLILLPVLGVAIGTLVWTRVREVAEEAKLEKKVKVAEPAKAAPATPAVVHATRHITSHP